MNFVMTRINRLCATGLGALCLAAPVYAQEKQQGPDLATLKKAAYNIDKHVAALYKRKKLSVPEVVDDATFLRRSFLLAAGRIPTLDEARMFLEIEDENKREMLASYLMSDKNDGYRSTMVNWVSDLLRLTDDFNQGQAAPYVQFVHEAMRDNMSWDQFTQRLLSAKGSGWAEGNGDRSNNLYLGMDGCKQVLQAISRPRRRLKISRPRMSCKWSECHLLLTNRDIE